MKNKLFSPSVRLLLFFATSIFLSELLIIVVSLKAFERDFIKNTSSELEHINLGILNTLNAWSDSVKGNALLLANNSDIVQSVKKADFNKCEELLLLFEKTLPTEKVLFTDFQGKVLASSNSFIKEGSDLSIFPYVKKALNGKSNFGFDSLDSISFAEFYSSPIYDENKDIIGTIVLCYELTGKGFVELIHGYGIECTIFKNDERVASTIAEVVGTKIHNEKVIKTVLEEGKVYVGGVSVNKKDYYSVYAPLRNEDGSIAGMFFVAQEKKIVQNVTRSILRIIIPICALISLILIFTLLRQSVHNLHIFKQKNDQLRQQVNWDVLTKANTRLFGTEELKHCLENFKKGFPSPAIMMLDVDKFKFVNDTYGHEAGDKVLKSIVESLYKNCRSSDKIIRWGGDEFIGIFDGMKEEVCQVFAKKLLSSVESLHHEINGKPFVVTVSIGFAYFSDSDISYKDVLARADEALYKSKKKGRNSFTIAD